MRLGIGKAIKHDLNMKTSLLLFAGLTACGLAFPSTPHVVHEKRDLIDPKGWGKGEAARKDQQVLVGIALKQNNLDKGVDSILEV